MVSVWDVKVFSRLILVVLPEPYDPRNGLIDGAVYGRTSQYHAMFFASSFHEPTTTDEQPSYPLTTAMEEVIDGTSNSVALSETVQGLSPDGTLNDFRGMNWLGKFLFF
jgi:hypothetical protein